MAIDGTSPTLKEAATPRGGDRLARLAEGIPPRADLLFLFVLGAVVIWLPPRPPMIDLPQHAAQITLLNDLLFGRSPWSGEVKLNFFTPYLIGYALAAPLHLFMPAAAALKVVLTGAYAAFIGVCILIRRALNAPAKLDGFYTLPFFGFAYSWGMYTYLVAAPIGLAFVWLCLRYSRQTRPDRGVAVAVAGFALLFSHGLVFLLAGGVGGLLVIANARTMDLRKLAVRCWPFLPLLVMCGLLFILDARSAAETYSQGGSKIEMDPVFDRFLMMMLGSFDGRLALWSPIPFLILLAAPIIAGLRIAWSRERLVIAGGVAAAILLAPSAVWSTAFIYERLTLFVLPAYAWLFSATPPGARPGAGASPLLRGTVTAVCAVVLGINIVQAERFSRETGDFEAVLGKAQPGQRALSLIFDRASADGGFPFVYLSFPAWYGADKHGFVDFNFAFYHPEVVRFRRLPLVGGDLSWNPGRFRWGSQGGSAYRYFFVRSARPLPPNLFAGADCLPVRIAQRGPWQLFERQPCPSRPPVGPGGLPR